MSQIRHEVPRAHGQYAADFGDKGKLALPPARRFAILTCMDARIDPAKLAGLREGDAQVIRNAGGRASDEAIRSLVISYKLLGTREWFVRATSPSTATSITSRAAAWSRCPPPSTSVALASREPGGRP